VLFFFIFAGPAFIKEEEGMPEPYSNIMDKDGYILSGMKSGFDGEPKYSKY
jgi:hypothetical protein